MRKADVLLAYLALAPGLRHPRERLINLLWSDRGDEQARNSLRQCLSSIRKALGDAADLNLTIDRTTVSLQSELIEVDAHEFERLALQGDFESLDTAASLYQGEFLEGISIRDPACQEWLDSERGRFKRQLIDILANLAETQLVTHDYRHAIKSAERLVEQDPLAESGWRLLMRGYFENGHRNHALKAYQRCEQVLRQELGVEPEVETTRLREQIAGGSVEGGPQPETSAPPVAQRDSADRSIVVLPFDNLSGDPQQEYFSDGITDSIILKLALFPDLHVKSRNASFAFKQQIKSIGEISKALDVDYLVEGSIRKGGDQVRINVQLIEAVSGNQVWGKRYSAAIDNLLDLEEELSRTIAVTVTGRIESDLQRIALAKGASDQKAYDLLLSGMYHMYRANPQDVALAIDHLNRCLEKDPENVRAHAVLYNCHIMTWMDRWIEDYEPAFDLAGKHANRAISLGPEYVPAIYASAEFNIFSRNYKNADLLLDKALAINPNDPECINARAMNASMRGDFTAAIGFAQRARELDPYNWWADWNLAEAQYLDGQYEDAIETIEKSENAPGFIRIYSTAAHIKLGQINEARQALEIYLNECRNSMAAMPNTLDEWLRYSTDTGPFVDASINQGIIDCLAEAGLGEELARTSPDKAGAAMPSVLVLPFENMSGDPEQEYFSDGVTESVILKLSSFDGLDVKSRHASFAYKNSIKTIEEIAGELKVGYVVEGSTRRFGERIRITAGLIEVSSNNQVWGKRHDSELSDLLSLEDELSLSIAGNVVGHIDRDAQRTAMRKPAGDLKSYDYFMRGAYHLELFTHDDINLAIELLGKSLELDPNFARAHARLGIAYMLSLYENCSPDRDRSTELMDRHMRRALDLDPENAEAHAFMAERLMYASEFDTALIHARKAIELNPTMADGYSMMAWQAGATRQIDKALEYADKSMQIDMHHPYAGWNAGEIYRLSGNYEKAIATFRSMAHMPASVRGQIAACLAGLDRIDEARKEMQVFLQMARAQMVTLPASREAWYDFWFETMPYKYRQDNDDFFDLLLKAGLCDYLEDRAESMPTILVLPFENMSGDPEQEYFSDGITSDIIATLSKFPHLRTISRYSTLRFKSDKPPIAEIANQLSVRYLLEGSVRKSSDQIRVSAELIDAKDGRICWSERYDRSLDDLFAVQDEITRHITLAMKVQLDDGDMALHRSRGATNIKAWELTLAAVDLQDTYIRKNILEARAMAQQATRHDPDYAYAWITLGWTYWQEAYSGWSDAIESLIDEADKANQIAQSLDPNYGEVWMQAGMNHLMKHEFEEAIAACLQGVELEPGSAEAHALTAFAYLASGACDEARKHEQNMRKLCPILPNWYYLVSGGIEKKSGNLDLAIEYFQQGLEVEPDSPLCRFYLIDALMEKGDAARARQLADEIKALDSSVSGKGIVHANSSDPDERRRFRNNLAEFHLL